MILFNRMHKFYLPLARQIWKPFSTVTKKAEDTNFNLIV